MTRTSGDWIWTLRKNCGFAAGLVLAFAVCAPAATPRAIISGYVIDKHGIPVAAASVMAVHVNTGPPRGSSAADARPQIIAATRSDPTGYFELYLRRADRSRVNCLFFVHDGRSGVVVAVHRPDPMRLVLR